MSDISSPPNCRIEPKADAASLRRYSDPVVAILAEVMENYYEPADANSSEGGGQEHVIPATEDHFDDTAAEDQILEKTPMRVYMMYIARRGYQGKGVSSSERSSKDCSANTSGTTS